MGTVVISADVTLGWGVHEQTDPPTARLDRARWGCQRLRTLCDRYEIPATWGVVGHLFLDDCDGAHREHPLGPERFERERTRWADQPDIRFGRELIDALCSAHVDHDIGCLTFSNLDFDDERVTQLVVRDELAMFFDAASGYDLPFASFIFPGDNVDNRDVIAEWGFSCYRSPPPQRQPDGRARSLFKAVSTRARRDPPVVTPTVDTYGLVDIPLSQSVGGFKRQWRRATASLWGDPAVKRAARGIDRAAVTDEVFHLSIRPDELVDDAAVDRIESILAAIDARRGAGEITVKTMAEIAREVSADPSAPVSPAME